MTIRCIFYLNSEIKYKYFKQDLWRQKWSKNDLYCLRVRFINHRGKFVYFIHTRRWKTKSRRRKHRYQMCTYSQVTKIEIGYRAIHFKSEDISYCNEEVRLIICYKIEKLISCKCLSAAHGMRIIHGIFLF